MRFFLWARGISIERRRNQVYGINAGLAFFSLSPSVFLLMMPLFDVFLRLHRLANIVAFGCPVRDEVF
jgi:hypothetical protein